MYLRRPVDRLPFPLEESGCRLLAWARHGIWHGVKRLGLAPGDEILAPAYHHGSEIEALVAAGLVCRFYDAGPDLAPDEASLDRLLGPRVRALHLTHYLGFPQDAQRWRHWCDERGLLLVEDAAQAWLAAVDGRPVGTSGHVAIFCLYKTFGLPEGAVSVQDAPPRATHLDRRLGAVELARRHAMWLAGRSGLAYAAAAPFRRPTDYDVVRDFELRDPSSTPWRSTCFLLRRLCREDAAQRRRSNYATLLEAAAALVPAPFDHLAAGASPFAFPLETDRSAQLLEQLGRRGIRGLALWSVPHPSLPVHEFPEAARRRERTIALPVHQELRTADVAHIAEAIADLGA